ncbi:MAG TPA: serine protease [Kofleriaceae bacterium]|nr:serine protease [Kofleriaceae bacterium]
MRARCLLVALVAACSSSPTQPPATPTAAPSMPSAAELQPAVFGVVIRKHENPAIQYAEPLPHHLLPHDERTDDYYTIGTAFTLDGKTFVSAAHVFSLEGETQYADRQLRDASGTVYDIARFIRYSGLRDLVVFTVENPPEVARPLERGPAPEVGATVHTVGNALGQGMSIRGGNVASFTPEPLDGAWKFIRYSAPASPGNSGGPLLDSAGRVVGVVVRRSGSENLNYAVPISELDGLSASEADFYQRISETESGQQLVMDWKFRTALPADYATLTRTARQAYYEGFAENRTLFEAKFRPLLFPAAPELTAYLRAQRAYYFPAEVMRSPNGRWTLFEPTNNAYEVEGEQTLYFGNAGSTTFVVLERPDQGELSAFYRDLKGLMDTVLRVAEVERTYAGADIRVTSFGEPHHVESWRDTLGRPWTSATWRIYDDQSSTLHCTPYPRGLACMFDETGTGGEPMHVRYARINALRWPLSYDGRLSDWIEYLALPAEHRPTFLSGAVAVTGNRAAVTLGVFTASVSEKDVSKDSLLFADIEYISMDPPALHVAGLRMRTLKTRGISLRVDRVIEPGVGNTQSHREMWDQVVGRKAPYDGSVVRDGETANMTLVVDTPPIALPPAIDVPARVLVACWTGDNVATPDKILAKHCADFTKSLKIAPK